jgi:large subunit ribosomal protein L17
MRHQCRRHKLGLLSKHRESLLANLVVGLVTHQRITTTLAKAKALRPVAEKLVTIGKAGSLQARRLAASRMGNDKTAVKKLFGEIAPRFKDRKGGYCRIVKLGPRKSDAAEMAVIEWVDGIVIAEAPATEVATTETKS